MMERWDCEEESGGATVGASGGEGGVSAGEGEVGRGFAVPAGGVLDEGAETEAEIVENFVVGEGEERGVGLEVVTNAEAAANDVGVALVDEGAHLREQALEGGVGGVLLPELAEDLAASGSKVLRAWFTARTAASWRAESWGDTGAATAATARRRASKKWAAGRVCALRSGPTRV